jgi:hypothetical protein
VPTVRFQLTTARSPEAVLGALTDFSDRRPALWPRIDRTHFRVHGQGPDWADVTEGNVLASERNRYSWDSAKGEVTITTIESDTWAPGSQWRYQLVPAPGGGTEVDVTVVRAGRGLRGGLIGWVIALSGSRILKSDMEKVLARL